MGFWLQLKLLLWKNYILRRRQKVRFVIELIWPLLLFLILMWVRSRGLKSNIHECHFDSKALPSAGLLPFVQSLFCNFNNTCHAQVREDGLEKRLPSINFPLFLSSKEELQELAVNISKSFSQKEMDLMKGNVKLISQFLKVMTDPEEKLNGTLKLNTLLIDKEGLMKTIASKKYISTETLKILLDAEINFSIINKLFDLKIQEEGFDLQAFCNDSKIIQDIFHFNEVENLTTVHQEFCDYETFDFSANGNIHHFESMAQNEMKQFCFNFKFEQALNSKSLQSTWELIEQIKEIPVIISEKFKNLNGTVEIIETMLCGPNSPGLFSKIGEFSGGSPHLNELREQIKLRRKPENFSYLYDNSTTKECNDLFHSLEGSEKTKFVFTQMKPYIRGKILYSPKNKVVDDIIAEVSNPEHEWVQDGRSEEAIRQMVSKYPGRAANIWLYRLYRAESNSIRYMLPCVKDSRDVLIIPGSTLSHQKAAPSGDLGEFYPPKDFISIISIIYSYYFHFIYECAAIHRDFNTSIEPVLFNQISNIGNLVDKTFSLVDKGKQIAMDFSKNVLPILTKIYEAKLNSNSHKGHASGILKTYPFMKDYVMKIVDKITAKTGMNRFELLFKVMSWSSYVEQSIPNFVEVVDEIINSVMVYLECFEEDRFEGCSDEQEVTARALELISENRLWAGIIFTNMYSNQTTLPPYIRYKIRMDADKVDNTRKVEDRLKRPGPRRRAAIDLKYITYGFSYLQDLVEHAIIRLQTNSSSTAGIYLKQFPYPCYIFDQFIMAISVSFPMFMVLAWVYSSSMIIKSCVYEKEQRLKEVMKVMGLNNGVHWVGWFIESFSMMFITIIFLDLILIVSIRSLAESKNIYGKVLEHSDPVVIFFFLLCYMIATITKSFMISTFFSKANVAAAAGGIIFFLLFLPYRFMFEWEERIDYRIKLFTCLISNVAFGFGCSYLAHYEEEGVGAQWHNLASSTIPRDNFSLAKCMMMMLIDSVIYSFITWYVEAVFPGIYGVPKPWYFFLQKTYWFGKDISKADRIKLDEENTFDLQENSKDFEKEPHHLPLGVCIENLKKKYGNKVAVDNLSLRFYEGQITSFLGHNGAGKTTTISILTGLFPPTSGTAKIYQLDIRKDIDSIRCSLGMCPQHNVLFHELTVMEHLMFYAQLKGLDKQKVLKESEQMIIDLGLPHKRNELSKNLSGGMQRKLSVAIAFVGGSRTVILDEPTAGVDPYSRRSIWELLLKYKKGRTIILTTHHMDEADLLGDRIAIISQGKLRCCGSSLFLKSQFGDGFYLTLVKSSNWGDSPVLFHKKKLILPSFEDEIETDVFPADTSSDTSVASQRDSASSTSEATNKENQTQLVTAFINSFCLGTKLIEDVGSELSYLLPFTDQDKKSFKRLFQALDVFLKVAHDNIDPEVLPEKLIETVEGMTEGGKYATKVRSGSLRRQDLKTRIQQAFGVNRPTKNDLLDDMDEINSNVSNMSNSRVTGWNLIRTQFVALHVKRFHYSKRNYKGLFSEIILPALFVLLAMLLTLIVPPKLEGPPLELTPWVYGPPNYVFFSNDNPSSAFTNSFVQSLLKPPGLGSRCVAGNPVKDKKCEPVEEDVSLLIPKYNVSALPSVSKSCKCNVGSLQCPKGAGGPKPPSMLTSTTDTIMNMTSRNISDWLFKTKDKYYKQRYGGFEVNEVKFNIFNFSTLMTQVMEYIPDYSEIITNWPHYMEYVYAPKQAKVWFNNKGWVSSMAYMNVMNNAILRSKLPKDRDPALYGMSVTNHPLNFTRLQLQDELLRKGGLSLLHAICVVFALSFVPASFVLFLIEERTANAKHLQFVSGVTPLVYWTANYFWDFCNYLIPSLMCIFIFLSFDEKAYVSADNFPGLVGLLLMYGWASIPLMYPASYIFKVPSSAFVALASANLFIGIVTTVATFVLELFKEDQELQDISAVLRIVFLIFPHFCLGRGLIDMATNQLASDALEKFGISLYRDPFEWDFLGRNLLSMMIQGALYFTFVILVEYKFFCNRREIYYDMPIVNEDEDVANEREKVLSGQTKDTSVLRLENLTKAGECFGLLGVNGAGKTSTFKMLTGDINVTAGNAYLNGYSILNDIDNVRQNLGYCPQFDALNHLLTGREHLKFYARLRGVPPKYIQKEVSWAIEKLGLSNYADRPSGTYSGGNKRKLSTAYCANRKSSYYILGKYFLARRFLWNCILDILRDGRSVILTSHSMEECEALCTRLAIMVNGELKCLGSIQHLKTRFGQGYTLTVHVDGDVPQLDPVISFVNSTFQGAILKEQHHNQLQFQLPTAGVTLSEMFHNLEESRESLNILDYSLSQTTLDQVFINFAKMQKDISEEEYATG
ncbi:ATP-binding cassette sub-family A member 1 [Nymphon striatum]|nr:ATP-binding cassette sub-family A member 1 [Nymphon striatum]